ERQGGVAREIRLGVGRRRVGFGRRGVALEQPQHEVLRRSLRHQGGEHVALAIVGNQQCHGYCSWAIRLGPSRVTFTVFFCGGSATGTGGSFPAASSSV